MDRDGRTFSMPFARITLKVYYIIVSRVQAVITIARRLIWRRLRELGNEATEEAKKMIHNVLCDQMYCLLFPHLLLSYIDISSTLTTS